MIEASENSKGITPMELFSIKQGIDAKLNLVEILAAIRVLGSHRHLLRKKQPSRKGEVVTLVEPSELREAFNQHSGKKSLPAGWLNDVMVDALFYSCSSLCTSFPGSYIHAAQERLKVNSTSSLLDRLGWTAVVPPFSWFKTVVYNKATGAGSNAGIAALAEGAKLEYVEHRALVHTALSRIDPNSEVPYKEQLAIGSLSEKLRQSTVEYGRRKDVSNFYDAVALAYNIKNAVADPKKKATVDHFEKGRSRSLNASANLPFEDATGKVYTSFKELPEKVRLFLTKNFGFENQKSARQREKSPEGEMVVDQGPSKKAKVVKDVGETPRPTTSELPEKIAQIKAKDPKERSFQEDVLLARYDPRVKQVTLRERLDRHAAGTAKTKKERRAELSRRAKASLGGSTSART
jgi:hypothetical protein